MRDRISSIPFAGTFALRQCRCLSGFDRRLRSRIADADRRMLFGVLIVAV